MPQTSPGPEVLDDLCARFILNAPSEERESFERLLFQVELAHWYYEDHWRQEHPDLKTLSLREFTGLIFRQCTCLQQYSHLLSDILKRFVAYKLTVPSMGAILLDPSMQKCLLVRGFKAHSSWGFPRGKVNRNEPDIECAIREVVEETGVDIRPGVREENSFEVHVKQQRQKLYVVPEIPEDTPLAPCMKGEIGAYGWFPIDQLPDSFDANQQGYRSSDGTRHQFHNVWQFMGRLKHWIRQAQLGARGKPPSKNPLRRSSKGKVGKPQTRGMEHPMHLPAQPTHHSLQSDQQDSCRTLQCGATTHTFLISQNPPVVHPTNGPLHWPGHQSSVTGPQETNGSAAHRLPSPCSSDSQASVSSHAPAAAHHAWLSFKLDAAPILDQLK